MLGAHPFGGFGHLGRLVLDVLGLVERAAEEFHLRELFHVDTQNVVAGDHHVGLAGGRARPLRRTMRFGAGQRGDAHLRREPLEFSRPVVDQGRRAHDQAGRARLVAATQKPADQLHRFAQAHFVGQDASEAAAREQRQPGEPFHLVGTQDTGKRSGRDPLLGPFFIEMVEVGRETGVTVGIGQAVLQVKSLVEGQFHLSRSQLAAFDPQVAGNPVELGQVHVAHVEESPVLQAMVAAAQPVAVEDARHLFGLELVGGNIQVDQVARNGKARLHGGMPVEEQLVESRRGEHLAQLAEGRQSAEKQLPDRIGIVDRDPAHRAAGLALGHDEFHEVAAHRFGTRLFRFGVAHVSVLMGDRGEHMEASASVDGAGVADDPRARAIQIEGELAGHRFERIELCGGLGAEHILEHGQHGRREARGIVDRDEKGTVAVEGIEHLAGRSKRRRA